MSKQVNKDPIFLAEMLFLVLLGYCTIFQRSSRFCGKPPPNEDAISASGAQDNGVYFHMKRWGQRRSRRRYRVPFICVTMGINCTAPSRTVIGWIGFHLASQSPTHGSFLSYAPSSHFTVLFTWKTGILGALIKHFKCNFIFFLCTVLIVSCVWQCAHGKNVPLYQISYFN